MPIVDNELVSICGDVPFPPMSAGHYLKEEIKKNVQQLGDSIWMTDVSTGKSMTYSQLLNAMDRVASAFLKRGFKPQDTVLFMASNHVEFSVIFFAIWMLGGSGACLTLNLLPADIRHRIKGINVKFVVVDENTAPSVLEAVKELDSIEEVFVIGEHPGCTPVSHLMQHEGINLTIESSEEFYTESLAWLLFSSGTTGIPKAIPHLHSMINKLITCYSKHPFCPQRKFLFMNNMINATGMLYSVAISVSHAQAFILSKCSDEAFLSAIDLVKPYQISCYPMQLALMCRHPDLDKYDLSTVTVMNIAGSCTHPLHERQIFDRIPNLRALVLLYGLSEVMGVSSNAPTEEELQTMDKAKAIERHLVGSQGKIFPFNKLKVIDPVTGEKLGPGQVGEICVQTIFMTKGYLHRPDETAKSIQDGWFHTGDQGYYDADENIYVIGRFKELMKYRMVHVLPSNIEKHLLTHPAVEDAAVVGLPHEVDGELPLAFIVLKAGQPATAEEIIQFISGKVCDEENLRGGVRFIDQIPRNDMKKIVRHQLKLLLECSK